MSSDVNLLFIEFLAQSFSFNVVHVEVIRQVEGWIKVKRTTQHRNTEAAKLMKQERSSIAAGIPVDN